MKKSWLVPALTLVLAGGAHAELVRQTVEYSHAGKRFVGYLAYDDAAQGRRPGVLVVHEWWGLNDYARQRADEIARLGYVAFAPDMYGDGVVTTDAGEAAKLAGTVYGKPAMRERARAGLDALTRRDNVDPDRIGAIGFCFGGTVVLELAYSGAPVKAVVPFHGGLTAPQPEDLAKIRASFLVLHGADDPFIKPAQLEAFQAGMREAKADWQMVYFGGALHAFTNPAADGTGMDGVGYDPEADARSRRLMQAFFEDQFGADR